MPRQSYGSSRRGTQSFLIMTAKLSWGARSIAQMATDQDVPLSRYRAGRLIERLGAYQLPECLATHIRKQVMDVLKSNELDRQFNPDAPNRYWCGDVTYIWTGHRWAYLAVVMDLLARKPIGWAMSL